jgi:hypothetical protein
LYFPGILQCASNRCSKGAPRRVAIGALGQTVGSPITIRVITVVALIPIDECEGVGIDKGAEARSENDETNLGDKHFV